MKGEEKRPESLFFESSPPDRTANWKTYRSEKYGFEFKYPKEYDEVEPCKLKKLTRALS